MLRRWVMSPASLKMFMVPSMNGERGFALCPSRYREREKHKTRRKDGNWKTQWNRKWCATASILFFILFYLFSAFYFVWVKSGFFLVQMKRSICFCVQAKEGAEVALAALPWVPPSTASFDFSKRQTDKDRVKLWTIALFFFFLN